MRRAAILLVSLSILSIFALALTGALVDSRRADAYFESELLCGERDSFEGVTVSASSCLSGLIGNYLYYGLRYDAASDESACEYSFNERTSRSDAADTDKEPVYAGLQVYFEVGAVRWKLYDPQSHEELGGGTSEELGALTEGAENLHFADWAWGGDWVTVDVLGTVHSFTLRDGLLERSTVYRLADAPGCRYFVSETEDGILFYYERQYSFDGERLCLLVEEKAMQYEESYEAGVPLPEPRYWLLAAYPDGAVSSIGLRCSLGAGLSVSLG